MPKATARHMQILARNSIPLKIDHSYHHGTPTSKIARNLGSDSCLRNWMHQALSCRCRRAGGGKPCRR